jgi:hypothetical protein
VGLRLVDLPAILGRLEEVVNRRFDRREEYKTASERTVERARRKQELITLGDCCKPTTLATFRNETLIRVVAHHHCGRVAEPRLIEDYQ